MFISRHTVILTAIGLVLVAGCRSSPWSLTAPASDPAGLSSIEPAASERPPPPVPNPDATADTANPGELLGVMAELDELRASDPAAQALLLDELRQADPSLWPLVVENFRSRVAYAQQIRQQETTVPRSDMAWSGGPFDIQPPDRPTAEGTKRPTPHLIDSPVAAEPEVRIVRLPAADDAALAPTDPPKIDYPRAEPVVPNEKLTRRPFDDRQAAAEKPQDVVTASYDPQAPEAWRENLATAIRGLESQLSENPQSDAEIAGHARLRLLQLAAGRRNEALCQIPAADSSVKDFWAGQIYGLDVLLDTERIQQYQRRAAEARHHLAGSLVSLGESATLEVRSLAFCKEIQSYGAIRRFDKYEFLPGQELLLYAEVENFKSEQTPKGYHTSLRSSYQIFDSSGRRVNSEESTTIEEHCSNTRRDYFIGCCFTLPKRIYPGRHTLKLTIEDLKSHKVGESSIEFTVK